MELIPGVDSIGILEKAPQGEQGNPVHQIAPGIGTIVKSSTKSPASTNDSGENMILVPFVRVVSTDLNFTVALALISVTMIQVIGVRARGLSYFTKYINVKTLFSKPFFGAMDFVVGLLEIVSEISKILSFSFRLFGNIFAGSVLLFVIGYLVPIFAQSIFILLEFGVGLIQAIVFGMLTMVFMAQATMGHRDNQPENV
jgi:F-type H+-transporting ATPase subunit a